MKYCNINVIIFVIHTFSGQVIVGGCKSGCIFKGILNSSIELFPRPPSNDCHIPNKPEAQLRRERHSLSLMQGGVLVICGGYDDHDPFDNCISWNTGNSSWAEIFKMRYRSKIIDNANQNHLNYKFHSITHKHHKRQS